MKRATGFTAVLMAAAMVFTMAGCGSSKDERDKDRGF